MESPCFDADSVSVTRKKSRFVPIEDWRTMETYGAKEYITIRDMLGSARFRAGFITADRMIRRTQDSSKLRLRRQKAKTNKATVSPIWNRLSLSILGSNETIHKARYS